jgi:cobalt/nickel transport protein
MNSSPKSMAVKNIILLAIVGALIILPLLLQRNAEFGGADGQAEKVITELRPGYKPWFQSIWEPPSGEIESLLFALQAAIGSGVVCYYLGYSRGRKKEQDKRLNHVQH